MPDRDEDRETDNLEDRDRHRDRSGESKEGPDRLAQPVDAESPPRLPFPVVGIGASAGGLEAFIDFLKALPPDTGMAFVIVQHLAPDRESMVAQILSRHTEMPVLEVEDGMAVQPDRVYVIRPGRTMTIRDGRLHLGEPLEARGHRRPVDDFFRSLAEEQRELAIAVVLSGMGSNGSAGAQHVRAVGGVCIAQAPETARFPSMPRHLIDTSGADYVLRVEQIPDALIRYASHPYARDPCRDDDAAADRRALHEIVSVLRARSGQDFSGYKKPTVLRRIQRRMGLHQVESLRDYAMTLRQNETEARALADDLVIHVTGFFRDPEAWQTLAERVIAPLVADRDSNASLRAWVTACASGEESYTLAILLAEAAEAAQKNLDIKVFATDLADRTLSIARAGTYPLGIESDVSPERLERFFEKDDAVYRVKRELREMVVFAPQNVLQDPPFSRIDVCTCRNLLIYLDPEAQRRVLSVLHFGLREGGALFLGNSETINGLEPLFEPIDKKWRIYRRSGAARVSVRDFPLPAATRAGAERPARPQHRFPVAHLTQRALLDRFTPPSVVVDRQLRVVYFHGDTAPFLVQPPGEPTRDVTVMAREGLRGTLRLAIGEAMATDDTVTIREGFIQKPEGRSRVAVTAGPLDDRSPAEYFLVSLTESPEPPAPEPAPAAGEQPSDARIVKELQRVRNELQSTIEELQTSNEELRASNEEVTSINEEFQSTNEELETSKEELQSLNEELITVNAQLHAKMEELEAATNDLSSLLTSTDIAVVFLDTQFRIRRFTPAIRDLIEVIPSDVGRPLVDLARKFEDPDLLPDAQAVLDRLAPVEREIQSAAGRWYVRRVLPYRTLDNRIDGVVVTFVDVSRRRAAESAQRIDEQSYRLTIQSIKDYAIIMLDPDGVITGWSAGAESVLGFTEAEAVGQHGRQIFIESDRANGAAENEMARAAASGKAMDERWHLRKGGVHFWGSGVLTAIREDDGRLRGFVKILRDGTEQKELTESLDRARHEAEAANEAKNQFLATMSHELRTPLSIILMWSRLLRQDSLAPEQMKEAVEAIERSAEAQSRLIEDLLDSTRIATGKLRLKIRPADLGAVVTEVADSLRPAADAKHLTVRTAIDPAVGTVRCDRGRMQQVVWNLLSNSVKFTRAGGEIRVTLRREGDDVEFKVTDTGQGIDPGFIPKLFKRFSQADPGENRSQGGLGLGLSIVSYIVEMHGGVITAHSEGCGLGATFVARLPMPPLPPTAPRADGPAAAGDALEGRSVLVVEDQNDAAAVIGAILTRAGAEVRTAASGPQALALLGQAASDAIVSDIGMPGMDGHEFIRQARALERSSDRPPAPALALTAFAGRGHKQRALSHGFNAFMSKPADPAQLVTEIARLLATPTPPTSPTPQSPPATTPRQPTPATPEAENTPG